VAGRCVRRAAAPRLLNAPTLGVFRECWADLTVLGSFQGDAMPAAGDYCIKCEAGECEM
jgi:hypothetical protein